MPTLALRALRYQALNADPRIRCRTDFFGAAAIVTSAVRRLGSSSFLCGLSARLEVINLQRAHAIRAGMLYPDGTVERNTVDFVRVEQQCVQLQLDRLRRSHRRGYELEVAAINRALYLAAKIPWVQMGCFRQSLLAAQTVGCCEADFASQAFRVLLGSQIALALRTAPHCRQSEGAGSG